MIRYAKESDIAFIYATTLRCLKHDSALGKQTRNDVFYRNYSKVLDELLLRSKVFVYHVDNEPEVILGFLICEPPGVVHFAFTKESFRQLGIQKKLMAHAAIDNGFTITHKTRAISWLGNTFNPYLLFKGVL